MGVIGTNLANELGHHLVGILQDLYLTMDDLGINDLSNLRPPLFSINESWSPTLIASGNLTLAIENQQNTDCHN